MPVKMMAPNETLYWVGTGATFNPATPTAAALIADLAGTPKAWNFSEGIASGYVAAATDSDTDDSKTIVDEANSQSRGAANYELMIPFYKEAVPLTNTTSTFLLAFTTFKTKGVRGYWVKRLGYKYTVAPAAAQLVSIFGAVSDNPRDVSSDAGGPYRFEVPFGSTGFLALNVALA